MNYLLALTLAVCPSISVAQEAEKPTDAEVFLEFGKEVQTTINLLDPRVLDAAFDKEVIGERITKDVEVSGAFRRGFLGGLAPATQLGTQVCQAIELDGSYSFLGLREREGRPHLLFRMLVGGALNYHELEVTRGKRDSVRVVDAFIYLSGEYYSQTFRRVYVRAAGEQSRGLVSKLMGSEAEFLDSIEDVDRFQELVDAGEYAKALDVYDALPKSVREARFMQLSRIMAAQGVSDEVYGAVLDEYLKLFPGDVSLSLLMIDAHMIREQYEEALKVVSELDRRVGGDPYLDCLRANILLMMGKVDDAIDKARRACSGQPSLEDTWWTLVGVGLESERHAIVAEGLDGLTENFDIEFEDLTTVPEFATFAQSDEGKAWIARQGEAETEEEG